MNKNYKPNCL